jgi:hypothetical protein
VRAHRRLDSCLVSIEDDKDFAGSGSADEQLHLVNYSRMVLARFISKRSRRSREFGWPVFIYQSLDEFGLITLPGIFVSLSPFWDWLARPAGPWPRGREALRRTRLIPAGAAAARSGMRHDSGTVTRDFQTLRPAVTFTSKVAP